ncbi:MAG: phenylacetate--CoA ligase family protein [Gammaproteobacteria bacterium]|jgi:phenylacetate-CoA ligase
MIDQQQPVRANESLQYFLQTPLEKLLQEETRGDPVHAAIKLFHDVAKTVPAYRAFLAEHHIEPARLQTTADFCRLPLTTKANYLQRHPLAHLCRGGRIESCDMIAASSGSTGQPTFWPRFISDELTIAVRFEQIFHDSFHADQYRTLAIVCFALGTWVGGMFTAACCRYVAAKGYPITVITPGNNRAEIARVVRELAPQFEQSVLLGYPPFLKDVIDGGIAEGIDWLPLKIKLVTAGEVFSEEWRRLVCERAGAANPCHDTASLYGTADAGVLGNETPLSVHIRQFLAKTPAAARQLFGESRLPTLVQYDPLARYFETQPEADGNGQTLHFTGNNGVPLIRYHIADDGGLIDYQQMRRFLADWGFDPLVEFVNHGARGVRELPFVFVFGRSNFTVSYFGANVYPENISVGLEQPRVREWVTGKFVLQSKEAIDTAAHLAIAVELAPGVEADNAKRDVIADSILTHLLRLNSEFANYAPTDCQRPHITLHAAGDPQWFPVGVKHRYTRR